eukprot:1545212-Pyramimonas_sp.AAC.1
MCTAGSQFPRWPEAFASTKQRFLGVLREEFKDVSLDDKRFFCQARPTLQPASGGCPRVECVTLE